MKRDRVDDAAERLNEELVASGRVDLLPIGAILVVVRGMILARAVPVALTAVTAAINQDIKGLICGPRLEPRFLLLVLQARESSLLGKVTTAAHGTKKLDSGELLSVLVPLPPLDEQRRIVDLLEGAAGIRRLREQALAKARAIVPALFLDMFGDPASNPKGWPITDLGMLVSEFRYGTSVKCHDAPRDGDLPVLRIPNVIGDGVDWSDIKFGSLGERDAQRLKLIHGDLLFVRTNGNPAYIGRCAVFTGADDAAFVSYLIRARLSTNAPATPVFVRELLTHSSYRPKFLQVAKTTAGNFNISIEGLLRLPILLPTIALQRVFSDRLTDLRSIITQQERSLAAACELERSLMARLLG